MCQGFSGSSMGEESAMKPGIAVGGGAPRECAAYLLDHNVRFHFQHFDATTAAR